MANLKKAQDAVEQARERLVELVAGEREQGRTWADIGKELGMSRQAAFKRFGAPVDPQRGEALSARNVQGVREFTEQVFSYIAQGDYEALTPLMHPTTVKELPAELIAETWRGVIAEIGSLERFSETHVELSDGTILDNDENVIGTVIGATVLECEAGSVRGRVAINENSLVVGLLIVPMEHGSLPF